MVRCTLVHLAFWPWHGPDYRVRGPSEGMMQTLAYVVTLFSIPTTLATIMCFVVTRIWGD